MKTRARNSDAKADRRAALLQAAMDRLNLEDHRLGTLEEIATEVGIVKTATYVYFRSKEELYMEALLLNLKGLSEALAPHIARADLEGFAAAYATFCSSNPKALFLCTLLPALLENHVSYAVALAFKSKVSFVLDDISTLTCGSFMVRKSDAVRMHLSIYSLAVGLWAHCHPPAQIKSIYELKAAKNLKIPFAMTLRKGILALMNTYLKEHK